MDIQPQDGIDDHAAEEAPIDVAEMQSWATLERTRYRDSSANRREYRAEMRHRAAEQLRIMELRAQSEAEAAAAEAEAEAAAAHAEADAASVKLANRTMRARTAPATAEDEQVEHMRKASLREAAQQARRAAAERLEAVRRAEAAALADSIAQREEREIVEAQASASRHSMPCAKSEMHERHGTGTQLPDRTGRQTLAGEGYEEVGEAGYFEKRKSDLLKFEATRYPRQSDKSEQGINLGLQQFRVNKGSSEVTAAAHAYGMREHRTCEPHEHLCSPSDESLTSHAPRVVPSDFNVRLDRGSDYGIRKPATEPDAHRLSQAGASQLRREQRLAERVAAGSRGQLGRVVVLSTPYKDFIHGTEADRTFQNSAAVSSTPRNVDEDDENPRAAADSVTVNGDSRSEGMRSDSDDHINRAEPTSARSATSAAIDIRQNGGSHHEVTDAAFDCAAASLAPMPGRQAAANGSGRRGAGTTDAVTRFDSAPDSCETTLESQSFRHADPRSIRADRSEEWPQQPLQSSSENLGPAWLSAKPPVTCFENSSMSSGSRRQSPLASDSFGAGSAQHQPSREAAVSARAGSLETTLQHSREQVASRWFALRGIFAEFDAERIEDTQSVREKARDTSFVLVYSLAGGVGKTSLVATLGRALSSMGEKVLLADTDAEGLLPFYFGAGNSNTGIIRTFLPPDGSTDESIQLVNYDLADQDMGFTQSGNETWQDRFEGLFASSRSAHRVLMDLNAGSRRLVAQSASAKAIILVPLTADMSSVLSLRAVNRTFSGLIDSEGKPVEPVYLLNQFDASSPLHLDVREVLKQQLGDRLLPFVIRRAAAVSEALAEGMTVIDYDPGSEVARDYIALAGWLRSVSVPAFRPRRLRWSER